MFSQFITQFYLYLYLGPPILAGILTFTGFLIYRIYERLGSSQLSVFFSLLLVFTLLLLHCNILYSLQGTFAIIFVLGAFSIYLHIKDFKKQFLYAVISLPVLFWITASGSVFFMLLIISYISVTTPRKLPWLILPIAETAALSFVSVYLGLLGAYRFAFLPDMFYQHSSTPDYIIYLPWLSAILGIFVIKLLTYKERKRIYVIIENAVKLLIIIGISWMGVLSVMLVRKTIPIHRLEYLAANEDWDKIIEIWGKKTDRYSELIYLNMALAIRGEMAEKLFQHNQEGNKGLVPVWDKKNMSAAMLSDFHYTIGNVAGAQRYAFEGNVISNNQNPRMLKRLIKTSLITGSYPIAERYIDILAHTLGYGKWANEQRQFLYDDEAIESDPELGFKRKSIIQQDFLFETTSLVYLLTQLVNSNPENTIALEYLGAGYLLEKNLIGFKNLLENFYNTPSLPVLPSSFQQAVLAAYEDEPGKWKEFNIPDETIQSYQAFKKDYQQAGNDKTKANSIMNKYNKSYWYYLLFKSI